MKLVRILFFIFPIFLFADDSEPQSAHGPAQRNTHIYAAFGAHGATGLELSFGCQYANGHHGLDAGISAGYLLVHGGTGAHADYLFFPQKEKNALFLGAGLAGGYHDPLFGSGGYYWTGPHACLGSRFYTFGGGGRFWKLGATLPFFAKNDDPFFSFSYGFLF